MRKKASASDTDRLRDLGWMTQDEFLKRYNLALRYYLIESTYLGKDTEKLHHPEDILVHISSFNEAAYHILLVFGAAPIKESD